jgi:Mn-containing catalase
MPVLQELLIEQMQDLLHAEAQLVKALPKLARAAHTPKLKQAFQKHLEETKRHVERLKQGFELVGTRAKAKPCKGMQGIVEEGQEVLEQTPGMSEAAADLAIAAAAQKAEHYEMSGYGTARAIAEQMGQTKLAKLLAQTLSEEERTDKLLTQLCAPLLEQSSREEPEQEEPIAAEKAHGRKHA